MPTKSFGSGRSTSMPPCPSLALTASFSTLPTGTPPYSTIYHNNKGNAQMAKDCIGDNVENIFKCVWGRRKAMYMQSSSKTPNPCLHVRPPPRMTLCHFLNLTAHGQASRHGGGKILYTDCCQVSPMPSCRFPSSAWHERRFVAARGGKCLYVCMCR